jgi:cytochrome d ubiquinol oxidase subunit I
MQNPVGFQIDANGQPAHVDAWAVLLNPAWPPMALHSTLSTFQAVGFAAAGTYAWTLGRSNRHDRYAREGLGIAMLFASGTALAQPIAGDVLAKRSYLNQPIKLAAMEGQFSTERAAPLRIGGWPDPERAETRYALEIPGGLSFLAANDINAEVMGLDEFPRDEWPNVVVTHVAFQIMVGTGMVMLGVACWYWIARWTSRRADDALPPLLRVALVFCAPLGFIALEAGWVVTEAGRQPWVIYKVMRTADAVTPVADVWASLALFTAVYTGLLVILVSFVRRLRVSDVP